MAAFERIDIAMTSEAFTDAERSAPPAALVPRLIALADNLQFKIGAIAA
jgi:hypothetical protein